MKALQVLALVGVFFIAGAAPASAEIGGNGNFTLSTIYDAQAYGFKPDGTVYATFSPGLYDLYSVVGDYIPGSWKFVVIDGDTDPTGICGNSNPSIPGTYENCIANVTVIGEDSYNWNINPN